MFVSKTIYNKPCTTNQKKRHEIKKQKKWKKTKGKNLIEKI
jgi:hypothetical protein